MKWSFLLAFILISCGPGSQTKEFFENACKNHGPSKTIEPKASSKSEEPEESPTPEPSPTPLSYDNRCSEDDKKQILADARANMYRQIANNISTEAIGPSAAELQVSLERESKECDKLRTCSGLMLEVLIPPGEQYYHCGMKNGQNWIQVYCEIPTPPQ